MSLPERIGKYPLVEELGRGAMGVVYRAFDPDIQRPVALKTLRKDLAQDADGAGLLARLRNEARAAGRLTHPGIVGVYEFGEDRDLAFIAMEYVQGASLREYFLRGARLDEADVLSLMVQLLEALAYAHECGVVHRDIKPANLIVTSTGKLKVADFGIARLSTSTLTQAGSVLGTPAYMAPEQYAGGTLDGRADVFSAGVLFYELLAGEKPFSGGTEIVAYKICFEAHRALSVQAPGRGLEPWDAVLDRALAKRPEGRYASALEFSQAIVTQFGKPVAPLVSRSAVIADGSPLAASPDGAGSRGDSVSLLTTLPPLAWDEAVLKQVEQQLTRHLGPVAKVLVRRAARTTDRLDRLYEALAEGLSSAAERAEFLAGRARLTGVSVPAPAPIAEALTVARAALATRTQTSFPALTSRSVENAARRLAPHLGPIARVVVKRAAAEANTPRHFHQLLAQHVADPRERERLLRELAADEGL